MSVIGEGTNSIASTSSPPNMTLNTGDNDSQNIPSSKSHVPLLATGAILTPPDSPTSTMARPNNTIHQTLTISGFSNEVASLPLEPEELLFNDSDIDSLCGMGAWTPKWLQMFANKQTFLALFCLTSVFQGVYYTYFVSVLTTIEKLYQIPSKTTGFIMSSTEIGQISGALLLTYYGGQGHRPRWISSGMIVFACAALLCSTPHYLFGSHPVTTAVSTTEAEFSLPSPPLCFDNASLIEDSAMMCSKSEVVLRRSRVTNTVLGIFSVSLLFIGLGTTAVNTLGIPYIDDNVAQKESPLYFGITIGVRIFGPVCGFLLGSFCTSIPADFLFETTSLTPSDTNWIGAWWLGLFLVGVSLLITSFPMMIFPRHLPSPDPSSYRHQQQQSILEQKQRLLLQNNAENNATTYDVVTYEPKNNFSTDPENHVNEKLIELKGNDKKSKKKAKKVKKGDDNRPTLKGFSTAVVRLLKNDILLCRAASSVLHILPISGLYTFLPKYLESQFHLTATYANMIAGLAGILIMGFGIFSSGTFMRKYKPSPKFVARWLAFSAFAYVVGMVSLMMIGCPQAQIAGLSTTSGHKSNNNDSLPCSAGCNCPSGRFEPVCMPDGVTYISPCLAGCRTFQNATSNKHYLDCSCSAPVPDMGASTLMSHFQPEVGASAAIPGLCSFECQNLLPYVIIFSITVLIHSTSEVGSMLLTLRCVEPQDKAMALGFISFATSLFGNVPCPILYGTIVDSTCLFWEEDGCGQRGACRLYDSDRFRHWFHGTTAFIMFLAFCIDLVVCYKADAIQFHEEDNNAKADNDSAANASGAKDSEAVAIRNEDSAC